MLEAINGALPSVTNWIGEVLDVIQNQPILLVLFTAGTIVPVAIGTFRKFKRASR